MSASASAALMVVRLSADLKEQRPPFLSLPYLVRSITQPACETAQHEQYRQPCGHRHPWVRRVSVPPWIGPRARVVGWPLRHIVDGYVCVEPGMRFWCEPVLVSLQELWCGNPGGSHSYYPLTTSRRLPVWPRPSRSVRLTVSTAAARLLAEIRNPSGQFALPRCPAGAIGCLGVVTRPDRRSVTFRCRLSVLRAETRSPWRTACPLDMRTEPGGRPALPRSRAQPRTARARRTPRA
jgi:hypothetical protein